MSTPTELGAVIIGFADPAALSTYYQKATGWEVTYSDDDFIDFGDGGATQLGFQRKPAPSTRTRAGRQTGA